MDFFAGAMVSLLSIYFATKIIRNKTESFGFLKVSDSQSHRFSLMLRAGLIMPNNSPQRLKTQATDFHDSHSMKVIILDDMAYWIQNNQLLEAEFQDGKMLPNTTKLVDTMGADSVKLKKITEIVSRLTERVSNEGGTTGDKIL